MYFDASIFWSGPTAEYAFLERGFSGQKVLAGRTWSGPAAFCFARCHGAVQPLNVFYKGMNCFMLVHALAAAFFIDPKMKRQVPGADQKQKPPRILWLCQWRLLTDGALVWETIDMENKIRQQPIDELAKAWPLDDDEVEEQKQKIRRKVEDGRGQKEK